MRFAITVGSGLQAGCASCHKQHQDFALLLKSIAKEKCTIQFCSKLDSYLLETYPLKYLGSDRARIEREFWIKEFEEPAFDKDGLPIWIEKHESNSGGYLVSMRKVKAYKKLSMRKRLRLEGVTHFGSHPSGREGVSLDRLVDRFIREGSCRHRRSLGSPCVNFNTDAKGACKLDGRVCDILTAKGERYRREFE